MSRIFFGFLFLAAMAMGCGPENQGGGQEAGGEFTDTVAIPSGANPSATLILGKWKLAEMRIEGLDPIEQPETFLIFEEGGKLIISNPTDPDLGDFATSYQVGDGRVLYENASYEIELLTPDSLILTNEVDNEAVRNIYLREKP